MSINDFLTELRAHAEKPVRFLLPDGGWVPAHFHITEVGHVLKRFIDCGGTRRAQETCLLQTWVNDDVDHRLHADKLAAIFDQAGDVMPHHGLPVEIEYEDGVVAQFPVEGAEVIDGLLVFRCGWKHTDCLARGICLPGECCTPGSQCC